MECHGALTVRARLPDSLRPACVALDCATHALKRANVLFGAVLAA